MQLSLQHGVFQLDADRPLAVRRAKGVWIECLAGRIWLTVEGNVGDIVLAPGEFYRVENNGLTLVEGLPQGAARLLTETAATPRATSWRRFAQKYFANNAFPCAS
ncbi:MAG TPA: DUF2917 domain-containing protein [Rhodocyclaceae bacterium]|nr:DUF2917 domain-containing protein [Rhodocyclaceae bacterium]